MTGMKVWKKLQKSPRNKDLCNFLKGVKMASYKGYKSYIIAAIHKNHSTRWKNTKKHIRRAAKKKRGKRKLF